LGEWTYTKAQGQQYGRRQAVQWDGHGRTAAHVVVPKEHAAYAVEVPLLEHMTEQLHHGGVTFTAFVRIWAAMHPELEQQRLILGSDLTAFQNTRDRLLEAWSVWQAVHMAPLAAASHQWSFARDALEQCLLDLLPAIRKAHLAEVALHCENCFSCSPTINYLPQDVGNLLPANDSIEKIR
jgi:hypothetical protein